MLSADELAQFRREVARIVREERVIRGLSLATVAERSGLSYQSVSYVEREMRAPTVETLLRIAIALGVSPAEIVERAASKLAPRTR